MQIDSVTINEDYVSDYINRVTPEPTPIQVRIQYEKSEPVTQTMEIFPIVCFAVGLILGVILCSLLKKR